MWLTAACGCSYSVHEQSGSLEVCVGIVYINGSLTTTSSYEVQMTTTGGSATSECSMSMLQTYTFFLTGPLIYLSLSLL